VKGGQPRDFAVDLRDEQKRRGIAGDSRKAFGGLGGRGRVAELVQQGGDAVGVGGPRLPDVWLYGGGGGGPSGGGASSSTYVARRPRQLP
jgi:hypothetical protein